MPPAAVIHIKSMIVHLSDVAGVACDLRGQRCDGGRQRNSGNGHKNPRGNCSRKCHSNHAVLLGREPMSAEHMIRKQDGGSARQRKKSTQMNKQSDFESRVKTKQGRRCPRRRWRIQHQDVDEACEEIRRVDLRLDARTCAHSLCRQTVFTFSATDFLALRPTTAPAPAGPTTQATSTAQQSRKIRDVLGFQYS